MQYSETSRERARRASGQATAMRTCTGVPLIQAEQGIECLKEHVIRGDYPVHMKQPDAK